MKQKILFVLTSHDILGNTNQKTGYHFSEMTHVWKTFHDAGYEIDLISPQGGNAPIDSFDLSDDISKEFWDHPLYQPKVQNTLIPSAINPEEYVAIYFPGGHGAMFDLPQHKEIAQITATIYENGGVVGAVCHGPAGILNVKLSNDKYLVEVKKVNAYTNLEETNKGLDKIVPFLLETELLNRGAKFESSPPKHPHVVEDARLVTGQNPASAKGVGEMMLQIQQNQQLEME